MYSNKNIRSSIRNLAERKKTIEKMIKDLEMDATELYKVAFKDAHRKQIKQFIDDLKR